MKSHQLVYQILARENDYISGEKIGEELNLSRTSIWKAIQRLQQEGLEIDSIKNRGYKLIQGDLILPELIQENTNLTIRYKPETKSTQTDAKEGIEAGTKEIHSIFQPVKQQVVAAFSAPTILHLRGNLYVSAYSTKPSL
ncbi:HTH domain protein (plasmid) [Streptococcus oralis]|nr:HTH domain protein [Streptococcus oralis]